MFRFLAIFSTIFMLAAALPVRAVDDQERSRRYAPAPDIRV